MSSFRYVLLLGGMVALAAPVFADFTMVSSAHAATKSGTFSSLGSKKVRGGVTVTTGGGKTKITLSSSFKTQSGPDLYIYVGGASPRKRIARLKRTSGKQTYTYSGTAPISYVHIYCKKFSTNFGRAKLR